MLEIIGEGGIGGGGGQEETKQNADVWVPARVRGELRNSVSLGR